MRNFLNVLLGFALSALCFTFLGSVGFYALACLYAASIFVLFYGRVTRLAFAFLIGVTIGTELLGNARFGEASILALVIAGLHFIFKERLRFTSLYARYIVAVAFAFAAYALLLFSPHYYLQRLLPLVGLFPAVCLASYVILSFRKESDYELV